MNNNNTKNTLEINTLDELVWFNESKPSHKDDVFINCITKDTSADDEKNSADRVINNSETPKDNNADTIIVDDEVNYNNKLPADIAYKITKRVLAKEELIVVDGDIWRYNNCNGAYKKLINEEPEMLIESYYKKDEKRLAKPSLASEIKTRICRNQTLQRKHENFNHCDDFINCKNGVVAIGLDSCRLLEHDPSYLFTYCIDAEFLRGKTKMPTLKDFVKTSLNDDKNCKKFILEMIGYTCSDITDAKKIFFLKGAPDSGKSVILRFLEKLVGLENVSNIPLHELNERFNKIELFAKKLNTYGELRNVTLKDISTIKAYSGGDRISAEFKHGRHVSYYPTAKHVYAGNALPLSEEDESTKAFVNRICLLIFPHSIAKEDQDPNLGEKLWKERNAIFTAAVNTLPKLASRNYKFTEPEDSRIYLRNYENNSCSLDMFLTDCCDFNHNESIPVHEFVDAYKTYCDCNALEVMGKIKMNSRLEEKHKIIRCRIHTKTSNVHHFKGITTKKDIQE